MDRDHAANGADLSRALEALRAGDLEVAAAIARRLAAEAPDDAAVHQLAAVIALQRGEPEQAARSAAASLTQRPNHAPTLVIAGRAAHALSDPAAALAFFRRAMAIAPARADAAFFTCATLLELGEPQAQELLPRLLKEFPDDAEGWRHLGGALQRAGKSEAALVALTRAAQAAPSSALHVQRGVLLESLARAGEAADAYRAAAELAPDSAEVMLRLGLCERRIGNVEDAAAAIRRATMLGLNNSDAWFALGLVEQDRCNFIAAIDAYRRALDIRSDFAEAAVNLGTCHQEIGDMTAARAAYRLAVQLRPDTFGRIAQALAAAPTGEIWLDAAALRSSLAC
jgi:tetratricopeptide (TPR) repeat protein